MSTPYEYQDESGLRVALEPTPTGVRVRLVSGALGAALDLSVPAAERLYMGLGSALTRAHGREQQ